MERETAGAGWWDVRLVTDRCVCVEVGQPLSDNTYGLYTHERRGTRQSRGSCFVVLRRRPPHRPPVTGVRLL